MAVEGCMISCSLGRRIRKRFGPNDGGQGIQEVSPGREYPSFELLDLTFLSLALSAQLNLSCGTLPLDHPSGKSKEAVAIRY